MNMGDITTLTPAEFLTKVPLYKKFPFMNSSETWKVIDIIYYKGTYDNFCTNCSQDSTFLVKTPNPPSAHSEVLRKKLVAGSPQYSDSNLPTVQGIFSVQAICARQHSHSQNFMLFADVTRKTDSEGNTEYIKTFEKIGQQPSLANITLPQLKKYSSVLASSRMAELNRAVGLATHDIGIGSYVYLRRVFEALVEEAHQNATNNPGWDESRYSNLRMNEKIVLLEDYLPPFLVENSQIYSLLSKGIHELSEEDCLRYFDVLLAGIELILIERREKKEQEKKIKDAKHALQNAISDVG